MIFSEFVKEQMKKCEERIGDYKIQDRGDSIAIVYEPGE